MTTIKPDEKLLAAITAAKSKQPDIDVIAEYGRAESVIEAVERINRMTDANKERYRTERDVLEDELKVVRACCKHWSRWETAHAGVPVWLCNTCGAEVERP